MNAVDRLRAVAAREPTFYGRLWLTSINLVGAVVVGAVLFDIGLLLGEGATGIFRRALYPLAPPAVTLGVGLAESNRRHVAISGGLLVGYVLLLALVGTLGDALAAGQDYVVGGAAGVVALAAIGWTLGRRYRGGADGQTGA